MEVTIGNVTLQFPCLRHFSSTLLNFASVIDFAYSYTQETMFKFRCQKLELNLSHLQLMFSALAKDIPFDVDFS